MICEYCFEFQEGGWYFCANCGKSLTEQEKQIDHPPLISFIDLPEQEKEQELPSRVNKQEASKSNNYKRWTKNDITSLIEYIKEKKAFSEIAAILGRTRGAITHKFGDISTAEYAKRCLSKNKNAEI